MNLTRVFLIAIVFVSIILNACNFERLDTSGMKKELKSRVVKRITPAQFSEAVMKFGDSLVNAIPPTLAKSLESGKSIPATELSKYYGASLTYISDDFKPGANSTIASKEANLIDAALYSLEQNSVFKPISQRVSNNTWAYVAATDSTQHPKGLWLIEFDQEILIEAMKIKGMK